MNKPEHTISVTKSEFGIESVLGELFDCNDAAELTQKAFKFFESISDFESVSLFLLNKDSFEFIHYHTEGETSPKEAIKYFEKLIEMGAVANTINSENLLEEELCANEDSSINCFIKPLVSKNGIMGMLLFTSREIVLLDEKERNFIKLFSKAFAALLNNFELKREVEHIKEISEITLAERTNEIVQSSREMKVILDYLYVGIFISDKKNGEIVDVNLMAQGIIGLSKEEIIGKKRSDFIYFVDSHERSSKIASMTEGLLQISDGSTVPIIHKYTEVTLNKEEFLIDNFMDISERKAIEVELQKAREELELKVLDRTKELTKTNNELKIQIRERTKTEVERMKLYWAVHQSPSIIMITDVNGLIEYTSPSFETITGYNPEEVIGKNPLVLISCECLKENKKSITEITNNGNLEWKKEFISEKKSGEKYWVSASISPIKNQEGAITNFLIIMEDINEKKLAEQEIIVAKEKAEASSLFKEKLLSNMSHEFRTPLISIIGFTEFLKDEIKDTEQSELIRDINSSGIRLLKTLNNVLLLSQLESLQEEFQLLPANIPDKIEELLSMHVMAAGVKGIKLFYKNMSERLEVKIDNSLFTQMMDNLIDNAVKYTDKGTVSVTTGIKKINERNWCFVEVKDTGIGIAEENKELIFETFKQLSEGYNRNYDGAGLGLTLAKRIAMVLGGDILLDSVLSQGSTFTVILPLINSNNE